ncbi:MAG: S8 family peptidase [Anaerolineae bacterium]|nr:S8 family peptidase [Gloeobacterales cyanobacterium ES-bin-313]
MEEAQTDSSRFQRIRNAIPNQYIVVFNDDVTWKEVRQIASDYQRRNRNILQMYGKVLNGFAIRLGESEAQELSQDARVKYVEEDALMSGNQTAITDCNTKAASDGHYPKCVTQSMAPWHVDRMAEGYTGLDGTFSITGTGKNITAYVVDTGILTTHSEFQGRAASVYNAISDSNGNTDCNGHGTFVAALIGGNKYGVAKQVNLRSVRVLDCTGNGSTSNIIAGINWITTNGVRPAVVNLSFGGAANTSVDSAVTSSINSGGLIYVVAAGNSNVDVSTVSPARVTAALTIGASDQNQFRAGFSNYGAGVDYYIPGVSIYSAYIGSNTAQALATGTSFSAPIIAGLAAIELEWNPNPTSGINGVSGDTRQMSLDAIYGTSSASSTPVSTTTTSTNNGSFKTFGSPFIY